MKKQIPLLLLVIMLASAFVSAQDSSPFLEHLQFFPDLEYYVVTHADLDKVRNSTEYPLVRWIENKTAKFNRSILMMPRLFSKKLQEQITSISAGHYNKSGEELIYFSQQPSPDEVHKKLNSMRDSGWRVTGNARKIDDPQGGGKFVFSVPINEGDSLYIVTIPDMKSFLKDAVTSGTLTETGENINKKSVFSIKVKNPGGERKLKVLPWEVDTLLVFGKNQTLEMMLKVKAGEEPSFRENENRAQLFDLLTDFPPLFLVQITSEESVQRRLESIKNSKKMTPQQKQQSKEQLLSFNKFLVNGIQVDDEIMLRSVMIHRDESKARNAENRVKMRFSSMNPGTNEVEEFNKIKNRFKVAREENLVFITLPIDMELAKMQIKLAKTDMERIEAEKKERRDALKNKPGKKQ